MRKILFAIASILLTTSVVSAQDIITRKSGEDIRAKVLEVTSNEVKYKLFDEPEGATYTARTSEILMIRYESGRNEVFNRQSMYSLYYSDREPVENIRPNMKYKELKTLYNHKEYTPGLADRYSPGWTGVASAFIPGLGECINGEWGRGIGKFLGSATLTAIGNNCRINSYHDANWETDVAVAVVCYAAALGIDIWSIIDAVRIAKVKNMYGQDLMRTYSLEMDLFPSVNYVQTENGIQPTAGLTFALRF